MTNTTSTIESWLTIAQLATAFVNSAILIVMVWYTLETRRLRRSSEVQHDREWRINYYFAAKKFGDNLHENERFGKGIKDADLYIGNLGRRTIVVSGVWFTVLSPKTDFGPYSERIVPIVLETGKLIRVPLTALLIAALKTWGHIDAEIPKDRVDWEGAIKVAPKIQDVDVNVQYFRSYSVVIKKGKIHALPLLPDNLEWKEGKATILA